jgi:Leucine Rich repeat
LVLKEPALWLTFSVRVRLFKSWHLIYIGILGTIAVLGALSQTMSVKELSLSGNNIGDVGAAVIADALTRISCLNRRWLEGNAIGSEGAVAIAEFLKRNSTLYALSLKDNNIDDWVAQQYCRYCKMTTLHCSD